MAVEYQLQQQQQQEQGRMGWDTFLVAYQDGTILVFDKLLDQEK